MAEQIDITPTWATVASIFLRGIEATLRNDADAPRIKLEDGWVEWCDTIEQMAAAADLARRWSPIIESGDPEGAA